MTRLARSLAAAGACAAAALACAGCGVDIGAGSPAHVTSVAAAQQAAQREHVAAAARLPRRANGQLAIAGEQQGSLTSNASDDFNKAQTQVRSTYSAIGSTEAFARLCRGEADLVDSSRPISQAELAVCNANGLDIRTPIQIASDAIVLATRNESDVGGDCLTVADVAAIYRRGSTIDNWDQLGFDDLPLHAAGPDQDANAFSNFASQVLGVTSGATLNDLRGDYRSHGSDDAIRRDIIGQDMARNVPDLVAADVRKQRRALAKRRRIFVGSAVVIVRRRVLRSIAGANRRRVRKHEAVKDPAALARRNLLRVNRAKRLAANRARAIFDRRFDALRSSLTQQLLDRATRNGVVGFVRFSFYEAYEDELRPLEIDAGPAADATAAAADRRARAAGLTPPRRLPAVDKDGNRIPNCIFPSQLTITTGEYPLSRRILLYTSTRGLQRSEVRAFLAYTLRNAQTLATDSRLVPITDTLRAQQYRFVTGQTLTPEEQPLPGEQTTGAPTTAAPTTTTPTATTPTTTTPQSSASRSTTQSATPAAVPASRVPGVSSGVSANGKESP